MSFTLFQLYPNDVASNFVVLDHVIVGGNGMTVPHQASYSMILVGCDADRFFVLNQLVSFNQPVPASVDSYQGLFLENHKTGPDQNAMCIILDIIIQHLEVDAIFHCDACLAVVVNLVVFQRAVA